jgi:hypothetical protein
MMSMFQQPITTQQYLQPQTKPQPTIHQVVSIVQQIFEM